MIPKLNSSEFNDILLGATTKLDGCLEEFNTAVSNIEKKMLIAMHELEYARNTRDANTMHYNENSLSKYNMYALFDDEYLDKTNSICEVYGCTIHPKFIGTPTNIFNLRTLKENSEQYYFRTDVSASIRYKEEDIQCSDILKHDSLPDKEIFFKEFDSGESNEEKIIITIALPEQSRLLGPSQFNTIEIDSFLNGSYTIDQIDIIGAAGNKYENILKSPIYNAGKLRIALSERYNFQSIQFHVTLSYKTTGSKGNNVFPFGLKHIYLYNANYKQYTVDTEGNNNISSYAIYKVTLPTGSNLNSINQSILIKNVVGEIKESSDKNENIEFYCIDNNNNKGYFETSINTENVFAGNYDHFYVKIPLVFIDKDANAINKNIIGIGVDYTTR